MSVSGQRKTRDASWGEGVLVKGSRRILRLCRERVERGMYAVNNKDTGGALLGTTGLGGLNDSKM